MTARPYRTICISVYEDDLQAIDAFVDGCPGLDRSKIIRLSLGACGVIPAQQPIPWPRASDRRARDFSELVQSTFIVGTSQLPNPVNNGHVRGTGNQACSSCGRRGHNARSCKNAKEAA